MFDIGFTELLLVGVVGLLVLGPERLPEAARTFGVMLGKLRRSFDSIRNEVQRELEMDEIRTRLEKERDKMGLDQIRESWEEYARLSGQNLNQRSGQQEPAATGATPNETTQEATKEVSAPADLPQADQGNVQAAASDTPR